MKVTVGIFWVINGRGYLAKETKEMEKVLEEKRVKDTGVVDSSLAHYSVWDKLCATKYPQADFATYPRGRIVYNVRKNEYVVFADRCISSKKIKEIVKRFGIEKYVIERDVHYSCDRCIDWGEIWEN